MDNSICVDSSSKTVCVLFPEPLRSSSRRLAQKYLEQNDEQHPRGLRVQNRVAVHAADGRGGRPARLQLIDPTQELCCGNKRQRTAARHRVRSRSVLELIHAEKGQVCTMGESTRQIERVSTHAQGEKHTSTRDRCAKWVGRSDRPSE